MPRFVLVSGPGDVSTICHGMAASMGAFLLGAGELGEPLRESVTKPLAFELVGWVGLEDWKRKKP